MRTQATEGWPFSANAAEPPLPGCWRCPLQGGKRPHEVAMVGAAQHTKWQAWGPCFPAGPPQGKTPPPRGAAQHTKWQAWGPYH